MGFNSRSYKEHHRRLLFNENERIQFFKELDKIVSLGDVEKVRLLIEVLKKEGKTKTLATYRGYEGESILHVATKFNQSTEIIEALVKNCPELLTTARKESQNYFGQTALHVAIAKGNTEAVEIMLAEVYNQSQSLRSALLHTLATGMKFANTVMMGELPLSVAALTFNREMIEALLGHGAEMERSNHKGDTVFHSLIRFAAIYPEHMTNVLTTMDFLHEKIKEKSDLINLHMEYDHSDNCYIWFIPNNEGLNSLQLAASLSQDGIFEYIFRLPKVYCFLNSHDGLFDRKSYDITEIDTLATERWAADQKSMRKKLKRHIAPSMAEGVSRHKFSNTASVSCNPLSIFKRMKCKSVLEMMFDIKSDAAFQFIQQPTVRHVIKTKWLTYRFYYYIWMVFHLLFMIALTIYAVYKAEDYKLNPTDNNTASLADSDSEYYRKNFLNVFSIIFLIIGLLHLLHEIVHILFRVKSYQISQIFNILHNGLYRVILTIFSISLILEYILTVEIPQYENFLLIVALITGWWFIMFFLRAQKKFSFFTVMIQKIIFGDLLRFSVIIIFMLIAFTAGIYMAFQGTDNEDLGSFPKALMLLFKLMLGLGDVDDLYKARRPWLAVFLFIVFVILAYVLMLNALIAMMSQTCNIVSENRHVQWRVQQLSLIMFFEGILPSCMTKLVGEEKHVKRYDPTIKQVVEEKRFFLDMSSLQTEYADAEDILSIRKRIQTMPYGDYIRTELMQPNFNVTIPTQNVMMSPRYNIAQMPRSPHCDPRMPQSGREDGLLHVPQQYYSPTNAQPPPQQQQQQQQPDTEIDPESDFQSSPKLKRRKSKREKSPGQNYDQKEEMPDKMDNNQAVRQSKRKFRKKRVDPEGDNNTSMDDQNRFHFNQEHLEAVPASLVLGNPPPVNPDRRRYNSENGLMDTRIGPPMQQRYPIYRVQPQPASANQNAAKVEIGVIADSYM